MFLLFIDQRGNYQIHMNKYRKSYIQRKYIALHTNEYRLKYKEISIHF